MAESESSKPCRLEKSRGCPIPQVIQDQMQAVVFGQCVGDAVGLLTEFMIKEETQTYYGKKPKDLKYEQKVGDMHRARWSVGDWTDDTDQMILILNSLLHNKGQINVVDFAKRMRFWMRNGFPELGDYGGMGIGMTTMSVLSASEFTENPEEAAKRIWEKSGCKMAANGSVMRTSILGLHQWEDLERVKENAAAICRTTHYDPRCQAAVVAVTTAIALMLQHTAVNIWADKPKKLNIDKVIEQAYEAACTSLSTQEQKKELWKFMSYKKIKDLELTEKDSIGYTYKCMGSGFWALRQDNFQKAIIKLVMEGGDADTNGCVAGALLGCKLGLDAFPAHWISGLKHKDVMDDLFQRFLLLQSEMALPVEERSAYPELDMDFIRQRGKDILEQREREMAEKHRKT